MEKLCTPISQDYELKTHLVLANDFQLSDIRSVQELNPVCKRWEESMLHTLPSS